jgi:hypothetical protein
MLLNTAASVMSRIIEGCLLCCSFFGLLERAEVRCVIVCIDYGQVFQVE